MFHLRIHSEASKVSEWEEGRAGVRLKWEDSSGWAGWISMGGRYLGV